MILRQGSALANFEVPICEPPAVVHVMTAVLLPSNVVGFFGQHGRTVEHLGFSGLDYHTTRGFRSDNRSFPMAEPKNLTMGTESPRPSMHEEETRVAVLQATVEHYLPEFAKLIGKAATGKGDVVVLHQDAFAASYDDDEYTLLGMAVKYAGLHGVDVTVIGKAEETLRTT